MDTDCIKNAVIFHVKYSDGGKNVSLDIFFFFPYNSVRLHDTQENQIPGLVPLWSDF